ncbi:MAG TPA: DUF2269 family protein [Dongiaceae bacterium]|nr:DUF2269 family protein [Dongiaceae bacterium]
MTVHSIVLFLHLAGALALFIGYGLEWTVSALLGKAETSEQVRAWLRVLKVSPPLSGAGLGVVILSGGYLASLIGAMQQGWIPAALLGIFVALALGFVAVLPRMRRLRLALPAGNEPVSPELHARLADPVLLTAIRVRVLLATGIVYLMAAKPALFLPALNVLGIALAVGLLASVPAWSRKA